MNKVVLTIDGQEIQGFTSELPDIEVSVPTSVMRNGKGIAVTGTGRVKTFINPGLYGASIQSVVIDDIESMANMEILFRQMLNADLSELERKLDIRFPFYESSYIRKEFYQHAVEQAQLVEDERKQFQPCNPYFKREGWRK